MPRRAARRARRDRRTKPSASAMSSAVVRARTAVLETDHVGCDAALGEAAPHRGASRRPRSLSGRSWSSSPGSSQARLRVSHEQERLHAPSLPPRGARREGRSSPVARGRASRAARPAANSSTHSAARRTVRPSAASVVASISTRSALAHARIGCRRAHERAQLPRGEPAGHRGGAGRARPNGRTRRRRHRGARGRRRRPRSRAPRPSRSAGRRPCSSSRWITVMPSSAARRA